MTALFYGWGWAWSASSARRAVALRAGLALHAGWSSLAARFRQGPLEWLWRSLTEWHADRAACSIAFERVLRAAQRQPDRHGIEAQFAADAVDQIALVALGQLVEPGAEQHEARRAGLGLGDVAQLDPLAARRGRRIGVERIVEPAVEQRRSARASTRPRGSRRRRGSGRRAPCRCAPKPRAAARPRTCASPSSSAARMPLNRPEASSATSHLLIAMISARPSSSTSRGDLEVLMLQPPRGIEQQHHDFGEIDRMARIGDRQLFELVGDPRLLAHAGGVDQPHRPRLAGLADRSSSSRPRSNRG